MPGRIQVELKPRSQRALTADQVIEELRPKMSGIPGMRVYLQNPPVINVGARQARAQYQFTLQSGNTNELYASAPKLEAALRQVPGLVDVSSDLQLTNPQANVGLNRDRIAALGLTADASRERAVVRVQHAPGLHDLRAEQRVSGHHAGQAGRPARSVGLVAALSGGAPRRRHRHADGDAAARWYRHRLTANAARRHARAPWCRSRT